jgi:nitrate reductase NapE component
MSRITVNFDQVENKEKDASRLADAPKTAGAAGKKRSWMRKALKFFLWAVLIVIVVGGFGGYFYWLEYRKSPAYSLALAVDAARKDDKPALAKLVDTDKIVDAFVPQITDKAVELYGRGLPPAMIQRLALIATPILPALKDRARAELPQVIREKTKSVEKVPFFLVALGASQALEIKQENGVAWVKSTMPERPLELKMQKNGDVWQIVEVKDDELSRRIAEQIGHQIISAASNGPRTENLPSLPNLNELLKRAEEALR